MDKAPLFLCWRPVTSAGTEAPLPSEWRFLRLHAVKFRSRPRFPRSHGKRDSALASHLPGKTVRCSIKVAYQAADAGYPRVGRASSPPSKPVRPTIPDRSRLVRDEGSHRKGHHQLRNSKGRAESIPANGRSGIWAPACHAAIAFPRDSKGGIAGSRVVGRGVDAAGASGKARIGAVRPLPGKVLAVDGCAG